jgi:hypothetical protein
MRVRGVGVAVLLGLLVPSTAVAAPTWLPPATLSSPGEENFRSDLAVGEDGTVIAVWQRAECKEPSEDEECVNARIQYSVRPPGGTFSPPTDIPGEPAAFSDARPVVAMDASGNAIAAWMGMVGEEIRIRYSTRPAAGSFGGAQSIPDEPGNSGRFPALAVAPDGRAVLAFVRRIGEVEQAGYAVRAPGGAFGSSRSISGDPGTTVNSGPSVELDDAGGAVVAWTSSGVGGQAVRSAFLSAGSAEFGSAQELEQGGRESLAVAPSGSAVLIWHPPSSAQDLRYSFRSPGGAFGPPRTLPEPDSPLRPKVAIAPDGSAVAAWSGLDSPDEFVRWAAAPPGGPFGAPAPVSPGNRVSFADLAMSDQGTALVMWLDQTGPVPEARASLRPPNGAFGEPAVLAGPPQGVGPFSVSVEFDPAGNGAALWSGRDPLSATSHDVPLLAAGLDAAGPRILDVEIPAAGRDNRSVAMSMAAIDVWSPVASTSFLFGDGSGGAGPSATHRYRAGSYTVQAGAIDAVGNSSVATQDLKVSDATKPRIKGLRVRPRGLHSAARAGASRRARAGIRFRLSERAKVRFVVQRQRRGLRGKKRFKRFAAFVRRNRRPGRNRIRFPSRLERAMPPGSYRLLATAIDRAGHRSRPARARFLVLP